MTIRLAVDTGGTFTDLVVESDGHIRLFKVPTTPSNPALGVLDVLSVAAESLSCTRRELLEKANIFVHGTTTATNAIVIGQTARTAFLTTAGHPDILVLREGGRIGLPLFDYTLEYPKPFVPRSLTFEVPERVGPDGQIIMPLNEVEVQNIIGNLEKRQVEAVALCLLWSIANPIHELRVAELIKLRLSHIAISLSHQVNPSLREYRRASSTAIDASLKPIMSEYLGQLKAMLHAEGYSGRLLVVTSQGMTKDLTEVASSPIHAVKSGPAMAPVAGRYFAARSEQGTTAIIADTGGTTYDVALVRNGEIPETRETWIGRPYIGHMTGFPSVDIRSVGAGGGSVAKVDEGGLLRVGPESAGAVPGPACYGRGGTQATVTDAALVLGYIDPDFFLGGRMRLDPSASRKAISQNVAVPLRMGVEPAAAAILALLTETMAGAIEDITVNQGIDSRNALLIGGGGAAGLNSVAIAQRITASRVLFPHGGAAISAIGGLLCPLSDDFAEFSLTQTSNFDFARVNSILQSLKRKCEKFFERVDVDRGRIEFSVEARYAQQIWEVKLPLSRDHFANSEDVLAVTKEFHELHRQVFAFEDKNSDIEFVNWRARASHDLRSDELGKMLAPPTASSKPRERSAWFNDEPHKIKVYDFHNLPAQECHQGPAVIETPLTSIVVPPRAAFLHDPNVGIFVHLPLVVREH